MSTARIAPTVPPAPATAAEAAVDKPAIPTVQGGGGKLSPFFSFSLIRTCRNKKTKDWAQLQNLPGVLMRNNN